MKRVVSVEEGASTRPSRGGGVTLSLVYVCTLECGHVARRSAEGRGGPPERLKCKVCAQQAGESGER